MRLQSVAIQYAARHKRLSMTPEFDVRGLAVRSTARCDHPAPFGGIGPPVASRQSSAEVSRAPHDLLSGRLITRLLPLQPAADLLNQQQRSFVIGGSAVKPSPRSRRMECCTFARGCVSCTLPSWTQRSALISPPATPTANPAAGQRLPLRLGNGGPFFAFQPGSASGALVNSSLNTGWCHKVAADVIERRQLWPFVFHFLPLSLSLSPPVPLRCSSPRISLRGRSATRGRWLLARPSMA